MFFSESLVPISGNDFSKLFLEFNKEAFRLELLQDFNIPDEEKDFKTFRSGVLKPTPNSNAYWHDLIIKANNKSARFKRVRLIEEPLSIYTKFEIAWGYLDNIPVGEHVYIISPAQIEKMAEKVPALIDYWLFDETICIIMHYDLIGRFLGAFRLPEDFISTYIDLKNYALSVGISLLSTDYSKKSNLRP